MNDFKIVKFRISECLYKTMLENIKERNNSKMPWDYLDISKYIRELIYEDYEKKDPGHGHKNRSINVDTYFCSKDE